MSYVYGMLVKRDGLSKSVTRLLDSNLDRSKYPDKFIAHWNSAATWRSRDELLELVTEIEKTGVVPKYSYEVAGYEKYADDSAPLPEQLLSMSSTSNALVGYETLRLYAFQYNQGFWGNPSEDIVLEVHLAHGSEHIVYAQVDAMLMLQKLVEVMRPLYLWSSYADLGLIPAHNKRVPEPWLPQTLCGLTMVFGAELLSSLQLDVDAFLTDEAIYDARLLAGPALWLSTPLGVGNELPFALPTAHSLDSGGEPEIYYNANAKTLMLKNARALRNIAIKATDKHLEAVKRICAR